MNSWNSIARRIRVPLGFVFAALYLWLAHPTWISILAGSAVVSVGVFLRAQASGHVRKNSELTTSGPYAYTRNPLYLGSTIIAAGFAVASLSAWVVAGLVILFTAIYVPVIRSEEAYLREAFPAYAEYAQRVPRFLVRLGNKEYQRGQFSRELYWKHREYNATMGSAAMIAALAAKVLWFSR